MAAGARGGAGCRWGGGELRRCGLWVVGAVGRVVPGGRVLEFGVGCLIWPAGRRE